MTRGSASGAEALSPVASCVGAYLRPADASAIESEWADLALNAVEPNPFYSPAILIPALTAFADKTVRIATVRDAKGSLIALAPVAPHRGYSRLPVRYLATWMHPHCFFAAPLVRRGFEQAALKALYDLAEGEGAFLRLRHLAAEGPIAIAAASAAERTGRRASSSGRLDRALLKAGYETGKALEEALTGKKRKELRRLRARLGESGAVAFETLAAAEDLDSWTEEFLRLERAGWKGGEGTALGSSEAGRDFFAKAIQRAFAAGSLDFHRLTHGGKSIAMIVNFIERGAGYSFKIAYDEDYARYSPGVLLEIEMMRALEQRAGLQFVDSCAAPDHPMINALWRERRAIEALNISGRSAGARSLFRLLMALERAGDRLRRKNEEGVDADI